MKAIVKQKLIKSINILKMRFILPFLVIVINISC